MHTHHVGTLVKEIERAVAWKLEFDHDIKQCRETQTDWVKPEYTTGDYKVIYNTSDDKSRSRDTDFYDLEIHLEERVHTIRFSADVKDFADVFGKYDFTCISMSDIRNAISGENCDYELEYLGGDSDKINEPGIDIYAYQILAVAEFICDILMTHVPKLKECKK